MSKIQEISILIPVYNNDVRVLVKTLSQQAQALQLTFEILCFDDASTNSTIKEINKSTAEIPGVTYKELPFNIGRSKIRNLLAKEAQFENLLFLDSDSAIDNPSFLNNYLPYFSKEVVIGGRKYSPYFAQDYSLHYKVGLAKETRVLNKLSQNESLGFMSNNFLIPKSIYLKIGMDESLSGYGHEDTKFGYQLEKYKISIIHIDNPIIHEGLDNNEDFISKTIEGVKNFYKITLEGYGHETKLFKTFKVIKTLHLKPVFILFYKVLSRKINKNLRSKNPSLFFFDLLKLKTLLEQK
jgi:GT2 family glycosyltransferase